jgi:uncharacterized coiled-coil protein SlyX
MEPTEMLERRVVDLEVHFMKLERELAELSEVMTAQQRVIDALTLDVRRRRERDEVAREPPITDERPPHY